ncbi:MAG: hypothetical protein H6622_10515 [Halobacteriovoraceae bacterium]|nr:hypothetical protein [Halobacteriovoraceae bacterium]
MNEKNLVLNLAGKISEKLESVIKEAHFEIVPYLQESQKKRVKAIIVRNYQKSYSQLNTSFDVLLKEIPIISLSEIQDKIDFFSYGGASYFPESYMESKIVQHLIKRIFDKKGSYFLETYFEKDLDIFKTIKIDGHLNIGLKTDIVIQDASEGNFNPIQIRNYLSSVLNFFFYLKQAKKAIYPLSLDFGYNSNTFVVQVHTSILNFISEEIWKSFSQHSFLNPYIGLLQNCFQNSHIMDMHFLKKNEKLVITSAWLSADILKSEDSFNSLNVRNINTFEMGKETWINFIGQPGIALNTKREQIIEKLESKNVPGGLSELILTPKSWFVKHPIDLKKTIGFINKKRETESFPKEAKALNLKDIITYLKKYPGQDLIKKLKAQDYDILLKCFWTDDLYTSIDKIISEHLTEVSGNKEIRSQLVEEFINRFLNADMQEVQGILMNTEESSSITLSGQNFLDDYKVIEGVTQNISEENILVKGNVPEINLENLVEKFKNLKVKISEEKIEDLDTVINSAKKLLMENFDLDEAQAKKFTSKYLDNASDELIERRYNNKLREIFEEEELNEGRLIKEIELKNIQVENLSKKIDALKVEILSLKKANTVFNCSLTDQDRYELIDFKNEAHELRKEIESRNLAMQRVKQRFSEIVESKNQIIISLDEQVKNYSLQLENKNINSDKFVHVQQSEGLRTLVDSANEKMAIMSNEISDLKNVEFGLQKFEDNSFRETLLSAEKNLDNLKLEKLELQSTVEELTKNLESLKNSQEKVEELMMENHELKSKMEEAIKKGAITQNQDGLKEALEKANVRIGELEHKIKVYEAAQRTLGFGADMGSSTSKGGDKKEISQLQLKLRQLEELNNNLSKASKRTLANLTETKVESGKLKAENNSMRNKIELLEKQVALYKKKAS